MDHFISNFRWNERTIFIFLGTTVAAIAFGIVSRSQSSRPKLICSSDNLYLKPFPGETFEEEIRTIDGGKRNTAKWLPADKAPKGVVVIVHGLHEHVLNYYAVAHELTAKGFAVYGMDHVGHGLSGDVRGLVPDFELLVSDLVTFTESVRALHPTLPMFMLAHSMGTLVTILACKKLPNIKAICFSGCALVSGPGAASLFGVKALYPITQTELAVTVTKYLARFDPQGPAAPILMEELTTDPEELLNVKNDPRRFLKSVMNKTGYEFLLMVKAAKAALPEFAVPFLALHGKEDTCAYPSGSGMLLERSGTPAEKKKKVLLEGLKHEIFHERKPHGPATIAKAVEYFESQL